MSYSQFLTLLSLPMFLSPWQGKRCRLGESKKEVRWSKQDFKGCGKQDSRMRVGGFQRLGWAVFPTGWDNCFSPARVLLFRRKMAAAVWCYIPALGTQQLVPQEPPPSLPLHSPHETADSAALTSLSQRWVAWKTLQWPLRRKERKKTKVALSQAGS